MNKIIIIGIFLGFSFQSKAQAIHELKIPFFNMFILDYQPSYEIISKKEKIGLEIGVGYDLEKARLGRLMDTTNFLLQETDKFKRRVFKTSVALKFYKMRDIRNSRIGFFLGPFVEYDQISFYEQAYIEREAALAMENTARIRSFVGQREIRPGFKAGYKLVVKSKLIVEGSMRLGWYFKEKEKGKVAYSPRNNFFWPAVRVGYRFGNKSLVKPPE